MINTSVESCIELILHMWWFLLQVAKAAREAGARRKQLARSIASTASSSGSSGSGKRSSRTMEPTASTQVTPDPKQVCGGDNAAVVHAPVEPRALAFGPATGEGGVYIFYIWKHCSGLWLYACMHACMDDSFCSIYNIYVY